MNKVSIIVPCYNMEAHIDRCLESLKKQTYKNIEIICVDDGSKDNTAEKIKKHIENDKRIQYFYKENGGLSDARNFGLTKITGEYISFIDSDDYVNKNYIKRMIDIMKKEKTDMAVCEFERVYKNKNTKKEINIKDITNFKIPAAWNKLYKRDKFKGIEFPLKLWYEDLATIPRYIMNTSKISIVKEPLYYYVQNDSSIMHTYDDRIFQIYDSIGIIEEYAKNNNLYEQFYENLEFANIYHILVGTIFRSSFHKDFSISMIKEIVMKVEKKYPKWYNNKEVKTNLSSVYKVYLFLLKNKQYGIIKVLLKTFGRYMHL